MHQLSCSEILDEADEANEGVRGAFVCRIQRFGTHAEDCRPTYLFAQVRPSGKILWRNPQAKALGDRHNPCFVLEEINAKEIHDGRADETGDEYVGGRVIKRTRRPKLLQ